MVVDMLHVLVGNDFEKIKHTADQYVSDLDRIVLSSDDLEYSLLDSYVASSGLFSQPQAIVLRECLVEHGDVLIERASAMQSADNVFIIIEPKILKKERTQLEAVATTFEEFVQKEEKIKDTTLFQLADLLAKKDKKNLWLAYHAALSAGKAPEEIHGILWWQVKTLMLIQGSKENPGLHPFVFNKNKQAARNFTQTETKGLLKGLVTLYHRARMGDGEMDTAIERFILEM